MKKEKRKCIRCDDYYYNHKDVESIRRDGYCVYCFKEVEEGRKRRLLKINKNK